MDLTYRPNHQSGSTTNEPGSSSSNPPTHHFTKSRDGLTVIALSICASSKCRSVAGPYT